MRRDLWIIFLYYYECSHYNGRCLGKVLTLTFTQDASLTQKLLGNVKQKLSTFPDGMKNISYYEKLRGLNRCPADTERNFSYNLWALCGPIIAQSSQTYVFIIRSHMCKESSDRWHHPVKCTKCFRLTIQSFFINISTSLLGLLSMNVDEMLVLFMIQSMDENSSAQRHQVWCFSLCWDTSFIINQFLYRKLIVWTETNRSKCDNNIAKTYLEYLSKIKLHFGLHSTHV